MHPSIERQQAAQMRIGVVGNADVLFRRSAADTDAARPFSARTDTFV
jgi:hypothetical protein